ncbi:MAG: ABC transporter permease, partial [Planctomycetota bacterium]
MSGAWTIYRRELAGLFFQPLAWVLLFLALLFNGGMLLLWLYGSGGDVNLALAASLGGWGFWILACVLSPLVTMRMISEESKSGLLEFLLTAPVGDAAVVFGKYLAASTFFEGLEGQAVQGHADPQDREEGRGRQVLAEDHRRVAHRGGQQEFEQAALRLLADHAHGDQGTQDAGQDPKT